MATADAAQPIETAKVRVQSAAAAASKHKISDLFRGSWFRLDASGPLVATCTGTRPGDPLADMLFGFSFTAYLRSAHQALTAAGVSTKLPPAVSALDGLCNDEVLDVGCLAWADDYTHMQQDKEPRRLTELVVQATSILLTHATANGMQLTFAEDKTATLLSANCPRDGASSLISLDKDGQPVLQVRDEITRAVFDMPVVASYKHLGSIAVANATPAAEVQYRLAQAHATLCPLQVKLFGARGIPLDIRRTLLRSLVISK